MEEQFRISHNREKNTKPIYFHSHDFYEIYLFVEGNVKYYIEDESYELSCGDVLVIPPGKLHRPVLEEQEAYDRYVLWIYGSCITQQEGIRKFMERIEYTAAGKNTRRVSIDTQKLAGYREIWDKLQECYQDRDILSEYVAEAYLTIILKDISDALERMKPGSEENNDLVSRVIGYLNEHVTEAPSLEQLSTEFYISKYYLLRRFKEYTKTTVHQYILMKKINLAKELLEQGCSPQKTSEKCGFSTYANFYKTFKSKTGVSPGKYKRYRK